MFSKVLIANRGEIAVRVIRACRDLGIRTVAVFSEVDRDSLHVRLADEAHVLGPAASSESYLRSEKILEVARLTRSAAIHPGYGFLSENADFAEACADAGIVFVGPPPSAIRLMADKAQARKAALKAGVPVVPGEELQEGEAPLAAAKRVGFPLLVKATAGGGGKGMRLVQTEEEFSSALGQARSEALSSFGDDTVYLERYVERPRHIEIQVLADSKGHAIHLFERECSIQRRHQKLIEECPSSFVDDALRRRMGEAALALTRASGYENAGTVEFLVDENKKFHFLEMNTRLQVEHPVTELVTGIDLVRWQIAIASGATLSIQQSDVRAEGWAMEFRITAENVFNGFTPSVGNIVSMRPAEGPGIRHDSGVVAGSDVTVHYDPMLAKLVVHGADREQCLARSERAVREYQIRGVDTTLPFFSRMLRDARFRRGELDVGFVDRHWAEMANAEDSTYRAQLEPAALAAAAVALTRHRARRQSGPDAHASAWKRQGWRDAGRGR